jgi:hypothetical protein
MLRMLIYLKVACIDVLTNLYKMYVPSLDTYIFQKLYPWLQDDGPWQGPTPSKETWDLF